MSVAKTAGPAYYTEADCDVEEFASLVSAIVIEGDIPNATGSQKNVPVYDVAALKTSLDAPDTRQTLMAEWGRVFQSGAGVLVLQNAYRDTVAIDRATDVYEAIIEKERAQNKDGADHFATAGANDRIWNSLQKLCEEAPETFVDYFANPAIAAVCEAWLGPNYQMTAQVNLVHPGGKAQQAHRDYHLGFQTAEISTSFPAHVHDLSPLLTLQGGIAHCDVPVESGPTKLLPFSQLYRPGYAAWRRDDFRAYFEDHYVQLSLQKGDAIFFNPALFHAAGENFSDDVHRMVNLLQVSSAFGRAMETIDRRKMCELVFPQLLAGWNSGEYSEPELDAVIACTAEGYSFPTNLDRDPPVGGLAPQTQQALLKAAVLEGVDAAELCRRLEEQDLRRLA